MVFLFLQRVSLCEGEKRRSRERLTSALQVKSYNSTAKTDLVCCVEKYSQMLYKGRDHICSY